MQLYWICYIKSNAIALRLLYQESAPHRCVCGEYLLPLVLTPSMVIIHQVLLLLFKGTSYLALLKS